MDLKTQLPSAAEGSDASTEERRGALGSAASAVVRGILATMHTDRTRRSKVRPPDGVHALRGIPFTPAPGECNVAEREAAGIFFFWSNSRI